MISQTIRDKIISMSNDNTVNASIRTLKAKVVKADESSNICNIDISSVSGDIDTIYNVPVMITDNGTIGWFPSVGDFVLVNCINKNDYYIVGPYMYSYIKNYRHSNDMKDNILTDFYNYTIGGNIF